MHCVSLSTINLLTYHPIHLSPMDPYTLHPSFYNQPIRLTREEKAAPQEVLQDFFHNCPFADIRRQLSCMMEAALCMPHSPYDEAAERQSLLWFHRELERALEAARLLCDQGDSNRLLKS